MSFQPNGTISPSSNQDKKRMWNHSGPEGIHLRRDVIKGMNDGSLDLEGPEYTRLYNKRPEIYGKFGKNSFRNNVKKYRRNYSSAMAITNSTGRTNSFSNAPNNLMFEDEFDFSGGVGMATDGFFCQ